MSKFPRDEFDDVPERSSRQGVHRDSPALAQSTGLGLKITVGVLILLIALGAYFVLPRLGLLGAALGNGPASSSTGTAHAVQAPEAEDSEDSEGSEISGVSKGSESEAPEDSATPEDSAGADDDDVDDDDTAAGPDRAQAVNVLNGTAAPGLASIAAGRLATSGWTSVLPGNWAGVPVDASAVFYNGQAQRSDAEAVGTDLGISTLIDSADISPAISVVLGPEYE